MYQLVCIFFYFYITQQRKFPEENVSEAPTKIHYLARFVFRRDVNADKVWRFELGVEGKTEVHICVIVGLQGSVWPHNQEYNKDVFVRLLVLCAQCFFWNWKKL